MSLDDRYAQYLVCQMCQALLVFRIPDTQVAGYGYGIHLAFHLREGGLGRLLVQRDLLVTFEVVGSGHLRIYVGRHGAVVSPSYADESGTASFSFDHRVGGQGGG